ncbi:MAG TPA: glycoside hydrolase family 15 protein [Caulobacteraceae bacterium]|nr:glycoside hydrolase family 15 protein [Caulobacteraceae bacterium]
MPARIEDYGLIGDCETAALIALDGSVDWLCWPRFDSDACFAALLGDDSHGRWKIAPVEAQGRTSRRYLPDSLILETTHETPAGTVVVLDFMPPRGRASDLVRLVTGKCGRVAMAMHLVIRFCYGAAVPWVTRLEDGALSAIAGPDRVVLRTPVEFRGEGLTTVAQFVVEEGQTLPFVLTYGASSAPPPAAIDPMQALESARRFWRGWSRHSQAKGPYAEAVGRSLLTLKALTYAPTGGLVAAPTTSLPERSGGVRNWDYRYCWIRDATLTLLALMNAGHFGEAKAWVAWLRRAAAGSPGAIQIMYGLAGERRLLEWTADWLPGYEGACPVRVGNAAHQQFQLDIYGELMDAFHHARRGGILGDESWSMERAIVEHVEAVWREPDEGIWEVRGGRRHFTFSKIMAWVAMDRAVRAVEEQGLDGPADRWREVREAIRADVFANGFDAERGVFRRAYDDPGLDASLLLVADVGFIEHEDPRFAALVEAIERDLVTPDGLVLRYDTRSADDGLPPGEGAFLPCSFWLANAYAMVGREEDARALFDRLLALRSDLGLLAEEYDSASGRLCGNYPQAFSHVGLLSTALNLTRASRPSGQRAGREAAATPAQPEPA